MTEIRHAVPPDDLARLTLAAEQIPDEVRPFYDVKNGGLHYVGVRVNRESGQLEHTTPLRLCDALDLIGRGIGDAGEQFRVLKWLRRGEHREQVYALALANVGERGCWAGLRARGLAVSSGRAAQERLCDFLQMEGSDTLYSVTKRGGWANGAYILPSGEIIGTASRPTLYDGDTSAAAAYICAGSLDGWRDSVGRLSRGNSRLALALGAALAAPLLGLVSLESGGFHLFGPSGCGKTSAANVGASVWGRPDGIALNWDSSPVGLSNAAAARNDGFMPMDEIGQGSPDAVSQSAYRLFNGKDKMRGKAEGGNRDTAQWRVLVFSTGEYDLATALKIGQKRVNVGQEVRLASLPADAGKGFGAFDVLHDCGDGEQLADALKVATLANHGHAGRHFVTHIAANRDAIAERLGAAIRDALAVLPKEAKGQARRVAQRFAIAGEALEIATEIGLTGWGEGEGRAMLAELFTQWLARFGLGNREDQQLFERVEAFFAAHGHSRFIRQGQEAERTPNAAGYLRAAGDGATGSHWDVFPHVFKDEIAQGFDPTHAATLLADAGMLLRDKQGKATHRSKQPGASRVYRFISTSRLEAGDYADV